SLLQRNQACQQVAAVHRRDVGRLQWLQRVGQVPVVEVPVKALQLVERVEGFFEPIEQCSQAEIAEIVGRERREKGQPHVRRGRAVSDLSFGVLLIVVRRQPVVLGRHESLEKGPRLTGQAAKVYAFVSRQSQLASPRGSTDQESHERRGEPRQQKRGRRRQGRGPNRQHEQGRKG